MRKCMFSGICSNIQGSTSLIVTYAWIKYVQNVAVATSSFTTEKNLKVKNKNVMFFECIRYTAGMADTGNAYW